MAFDPPSGFLTRPEAARLYNRSQRALQRDLDTALRVGDSDALAHWKLMTKEGELRNADDVSIDLVKQLQSEGKVPVWYITESYLESQYGRKGMPKPRKTQDRSIGNQFKPPVESPHQEDSATEQADPSPNDIEFLKERIRTLEREKREEAERSEKREEKLYEQLAVKDKQISAWDDLTQGLMRGLATGQLKPDLATLLLDTPAKSPISSDAKKGNQSIKVVEQATNAASKPNKRVAGAASSAKRSSRKPKKSTPSKRLPKQQAAPNAKGAKDKPRWFDTPTFSRFLSRK